MDEQPEKPDYMTDEQWARFQAWQREHPYGEQDENGIDLSLLRANLKLTPTERIERMRHSLAFALLADRRYDVAGLSSNH